VVHKTWRLETVGEIYNPGYSVLRGLIWAQCIEQNWPQGDQRWEASAPLNRLGQPEDFADACLFLVSPAARWITGAELRVTGGVMTNQFFC